MSSSSSTMKETDTVVVQLSSHPKTITRVSKILPSQCKICGASALYSYFGVVVCNSCKMFFRRNVMKKQSSFKCHFNGHCEINTNNRHICSSCRLSKCLSNGMCSDLIRSPIAKKNDKTNRDKKLINDSTRTNQSLQIPTLNLLQSDESMLNADHWNLLSNLIHCYDEHSGYLLSERFVCEQNILPVKLRYKCGPVEELLTSSAYEVQQLFKNNNDFLSLFPDDRSILLRNTIPYVTCLSATIAVRRPQLYDNPVFFKAAGTIFGVKPMVAARRVYEQLDSDLLFVKLILTILIFSTIHIPFNIPTRSTNLMNIKSVFHIQDMYIELLWRYLLYKYNFKQAVLCLSNMIKCLFAVIEAVNESQDIKQHTNLINNLIQETEQKLIINNE